MLTQALPILGGLILVAYAFKFAALANMNQGCIPSLFQFASVYIAITFYIKFNEAISWCKIFGIFLMIACVITLSFAPKADSDDTTSDLTIEDQQMYRVIAVIIGCTAPFTWTFQTFFARRAIERKDFPIFEMAID